MMRATLLLNAIVLSAAQQYAFDFSDAKSPAMMEAGTPLFTRMLQIDAEEEPCYAEGPNLVCRYGFELGNLTNPTQVTFIARCDLSSTTGFDYRQASGCSCQAQVTNPESGAVKVCPCTICQEGFGETPIQVDCEGAGETPETNATVSGNTTVVSGNTTAVESQEEGGSAAVPPARRTQATAGDPYVYSTCTSVDCAGACNGTCAFNCDESGASCPFCANYEGNQPTIAPTGASNGGGITNFGVSGAATVTTTLLGLVAIVVAIAV